MSSNLRMLPNCTIGSEVGAFLLLRVAVPFAVIYFLIYFKIRKYVKMVETTRLVIKSDIVTVKKVFIGIIKFDTEPKISNFVLSRQHT